MHLQEITLINFRSFEKFSTNFSPLSVIVGANSSGKTNILESIWLLAVGKSLRGSEERELIKFGADFAKIEGGNGQNLKLEVRLEVNDDKLKKSFLVNAVYKRLTDFIGNLKVVSFSPPDLDLVTDSPGLRRDHLDTVLGQIDKDYRRVIIAYERALKSRNRLLLAISQNKAKRTELEFWDETLIKLGSFITHKRQESFAFLNNVKSEFGAFSWKYQPNIASKENLATSFEKDLQTTATNIGPHRDEFRFLLNNTDLGLFGARGEQRLAVLVLKLAELEFMSLKTGERPVLLLDDIFSELDAAHRAEIAKIVGGQQTILTTTDIGNLDAKFAKKADVIEL